MPDTKSLGNTLDPYFWDRCLAEFPQGSWSALASAFHQYSNPRLTAWVVFFLFCSLPIMLVGAKALSHLNFGRFVRARLGVLFFLHRVNYTLLLVVVLYCVFRQWRPCLINNVQLGPFYGMPSGDATLGAILGTTLFMAAPFSVVGSRVLAVLFVLGKAAERVVLGLHSLGQVSSGMVLGVLLHFYSTRIPIFVVIFIEPVLEVVAGFVLLSSDPNMVFGHLSSQSNMFGWLLYGIAFQSFVCIMLWRHCCLYYRDWKATMKMSYNQLMMGLPMLRTDILDVDEDEEFGGSLLPGHDSEEVGYGSTPTKRQNAANGSPQISITAQRVSDEERRAAVGRASDIWWMLFSILVMFLIILLAYLVMYLDWFDRPGFVRPFIGTAQ